MVGHSDKGEEERVMDEAGIIEELTAELEALRKRLYELEEEYALCKQKGESCYQELLSFKRSKETLSMCFNVGEATEERPLVITGIALAEGKWNDKYYDHEVVSQALELLKEMPVYVEHRKIEEYGERQVGEVIAAEWNDLIKAALFKISITDEDAKKDILSGRFKAVSLGGYTEVELENGEKVVKKLLFDEISLTETPACTKCLIMHVENLSKYLREKEEKEKSGENIMSEEEMTQETTEEEKTEESVEQAQEETPMEAPEETVQGEEYFELTEETVLVFPESIELELMSLEEALARRRMIYPMPVGRYPRKMRKIATYYYYPGIYPMPYLMPYYYPYMYPLPEEAIREIREAIEKIVKKYRKTKQEEEAKPEEIEKKEEEEMPLKCEYCDFVAENKQELLDHIANKHPEEFEKRYGYPPKTKMEKEEKKEEEKTEMSEEEIDGIKAIHIMAKQLLRI